MASQDIIAILQGSNTITANFIPVNLNVPPVLKTKTITANGYYSAESDSADGYSSVTVVIPGPTGTKSITANGVYDITGFASADVQVPLPTHYLEFVNDNGVLSKRNALVNINGVTDIGGRGTFSNAYYYVQFPSNTALDFSNLVSISGQASFQAAFQGASGITTADFRNVTTITGGNAFNSAFFASSITGFDMRSLISGSIIGVFQQAFVSCRALISVNFNALTTISGGSFFVDAFQNCTALPAIEFNSLTTISGEGVFDSTFSGCTALISAKFNAFNTIGPYSFCPSYGRTFAGCTHLESVEFGGVKASTFSSNVNAIAYLFNSTTGSQAPNGCTIHFPSNFDPSDPNHTFDASTLGGYPTFGGRTSYMHIAFDLPATE